MGKIIILIVISQLKLVWRSERTSLFVILFIFVVHYANLNKVTILSYVFRLCQLYFVITHIISHDIAIKTWKDVKSWSCKYQTKMCSCDCLSCWQIRKFCGLLLIVCVVNSSFVIEFWRHLFVSVCTLPIYFVCWQHLYIINIKYYILCMVLLHSYVADVCC